METDVFVHESSCIDTDVVIGRGTRIWHFSHVLKGAVIGRQCNLGQNVCVAGGVIIGNRVKIQNNVSVYDGVVLEDDVFLGPSCVLTNVTNPRSEINRKHLYEKTIIRKGATVGANATIVCGVTIGRYAFVAAGAVVTRDIPDYGLAIGVPARHDGWVSRHGHPMREKQNGVFLCPESGFRYEENPSGELHCLDLAEDAPLPEDLNRGFLNRHAMTIDQQISFIDLAAQSVKLGKSVETAVNKVMTHGQFIMGPEVTALEKALASYSGCTHAVSCSSGTDALLMALMALNIQPGDAVFTTPFSFIATAEVIALLGAVPVFVDIHEATFNIDPAKLDIAVSEWIQHGQGRAKCIIAVDIFGLPADYERINQIAETHNLAVVQDGAQSFGARLNDKRTGNLTTLGTTSFFPSKPLGCFGDGGAIFTNDMEMAKALASIRVHGKGQNKYDNIRLGINGRLDTIQAAVLLEKLKIFDWEMSQRRKLADLYQDKLGGRVHCQTEPEGSQSAWALFSFASDRRREIIAALAAQGIPYSIYYPKPLHLQDVFSGLNHCPGDFPVSESLTGKILSIPFHPYLGTEAALYISDVILAALDTKKKPILDNRLQERPGAPMYQNKTICAVVPCYNEETQISMVVNTMPDYVDRIVIIDDKSRDQTVQKTRTLMETDHRIVLIEHGVNQGVGGAIASGYKWARDNNIDIAVVMAGDGQMDPENLPALLAPVVSGKADYTKGNRLVTGEAFKKIPKLRYFGNGFLSLFTKIASGYWNIADSQSGYTAINRDCLHAIDWDKMYKRYGQPNDLLVRLNVENFRVADVPVEPVYNVGEVSGIKIRKVIFTIAWLLVKLFFWRMKEKYIIRDFHPLVFFYLLGGIFAVSTVLLFVRLFFIWYLTSHIPPINALAAMFSFISASQFNLFAMWFDMEANKDLKV